MTLKVNFVSLAFVRDYYCEHNENQVQSFLKTEKDFKLKITWFFKHFDSNYVSKDFSK